MSGWVWFPCRFPREAAIRGLVILALVMAAASVMLVPVMMQFDFDPMPGDFVFNYQNHHFAIPVLWSLCAGVGLGLFYKIMKK